MKHIVRILFLTSFVLLTSLINKIKAQEKCQLQPPLIKIDFGSGEKTGAATFYTSENYHRVYDNCPGDGNYAILSSTIGCFDGHWVPLLQDHTSGDDAGNMLIVNASYQQGLFFSTQLRGLQPNSIYELGAWLMNICKPEFECTYIRPELRFVIEDVSGRELAKFSTGEVPLTGKVAWLQYSAMFRTPATIGSLTLKIFTKGDGGCGNDFALDDITVSECIISKKNAPALPKSKPVIKPPVAVSKPVMPAGQPEPKPAKKIILVITKAPVGDTPVVTGTVIRNRPEIALPKPILTRANPIVRQIETVSSEIVVDLYDNGEIDGDTVSIYHNNELVVSRAGLSEKPVTFRFNVDPSHPHHELIMVANNLGSIPPNTSLMIVTAKDKRYEVFISSSEQKNAKVVIDLKNP